MTFVHYKAFQFSIPQNVNRSLLTGLIYVSIPKVISDIIPVLHFFCCLVILNEITSFHAMTAYILVRLTDISYSAEETGSTKDITFLLAGIRVNKVPWNTMT